MSFKVTLKHVDSGLGNITKFELFRRAVASGNKRIHSMALAASSESTIESPIHPGTGEFLMELSIGTPPLPYSAILDTGSDLIWTQCKPCEQCFDQPSPIFDPANSLSFSKTSRSSDICGTLPSSICGGAGECEYLYTYSNSSSTQGFMATETLTFFGNVSIPNIGFSFFILDSRCSLLVSSNSCTLYSKLKY